MFCHQHQLQQLLQPNQYYQEDQYRREVEHLFLPGWHCVATTSDLPQAGDFLTMELLGQPLLLRNTDGEIGAYLTVCPHRHCLLTHQLKGHDSRFRCQYHGWEFTKEGKTGRIPDASSFRPFDRENARLHRFRTATHGGMVFVCLDEQGPDLGEFLGPFDEQAAQWFGPPFRQVLRYQADYAANWKVVVENSLESYHVPCLHQKTFGDMPPEEDQEHDLAQHFTELRARAPNNWISRFQAWMVRRLGRIPTRIYLHRHVHPHLIFTSLDVHHMVQVMLPTSPTTTRHLAWVASLRSSRRGPVLWLLANFLGWVVKKVARQILLEDSVIFADVQRGLQASGHKGCISRREERLHVFQDYVNKALADVTEPAPPRWVK